MGTELPSGFDAGALDAPPLAGASGFLPPNPADDFEHTVRAHARYFCDMLEQAGSRLNGAGVADGGRGQLEAVRLIRLEEENVLEALDTATRRREVSWLLPLSQHYCRFLEHQGASMKLVSRFTPLLTLAREAGDPRLTMVLENGICRSLWQIGQLDEARAMLEHALKSARDLGDLANEARALNSLGVLEHLQGNYELAEDYHRQSIGISRASRDQAGEAAALTNLGIVHFLRGEYAAAREAVEEGLRIRIALGNLHGEANSISNIGIIDLAEQDNAAARTRFEQAHRLHSKIGDRRGQCMAGSNLGILEHRLGNLDAAERMHEHSLELCAELGDSDTAAYLHADLGIIAGRRGQHRKSARLHALALSARIDLNDKVGMLTSCALAASPLARLGELRPAAIALYGAQHNFVALEVDQESVVAEQMQLGREALQSAQVPSADLEQWSGAARQMSVDELARRTLAALSAAQQEG